MNPNLVTIMFAVLLLGCSPSQDDVRRIVQEELGRAAERTVVRPVDVIGPYSPAVRVGRLLFVSGQIAIDRETGALRSENIEVETRQVMANLMSILRAAGYDSSHVVNANVFLKNMNDYAKMNLIYGGYFPEDSYPARVTVGVSELPRQANIEVSLIAYK